MTIRMTKVAIRAPNHGGYDAPELGQDLPGIALEQACGAADRFDGEHARQQRADDAANAVDTPNVERVIVAQGLLHSGGHEEADQTGSNTDPKCPKAIDEAASRG